MESWVCLGLHGAHILGQHLGEAVPVHSACGCPLRNWGSCSYRLRRVGAGVRNPSLSCGEGRWGTGQRRSLGVSAWGRGEEEAEGQPGADRAGRQENGASGVSSQGTFLPLVTFLRCSLGKLACVAGQQGGVLSVL